MPEKYRIQKVLDEAKKKPGTDMQAVLKLEGGPGWKQLTDDKTGQPVNTWQFLHEKGYGFVTKVKDKYEWEANRGDRPPDFGNRSNLGDAQAEVVRRVTG
jgi:hypothetical protein